MIGAEVIRGERHWQGKSASRPNAAIVVMSVMRYIPTNILANITTFVGIFGTVFDGLTCVKSSYGKSKV